MPRNLSRFRQRLTYANVAATLALFLALTTGGAYAAAHLAKNSVGPKQLRKGAVTSRAIKNGGVTAKDLSTAVRRGLGGIGRANVDAGGALTQGTATGASRTDPNVFTVNFKRDVSLCTYAATLARVGGVDDPAPGRITASPGTQGSVVVRTYDAGGGAVPASFHLLVAC